jgi:hypothetical protein
MYIATELQYNKEGRRSKEEENRTGMKNGKV